MDELLPLAGTATAVLVVNGAPIRITVDGNNAPLSAGNFIDLVERKFYDGISFHRVVTTPTPFVAQAGDPNSKDPNFPVSQLGSGGFINPATNQTRTIPLEILPQGASQPVIGQTFTSAGITAAPVLPNNRGTIAWARTNQPNSASSQFYINLANNNFLDGNFAVFGNTVAGLETVDRIQQGDRISVAKVVDGIVPSRSSNIIRDLPLLNRFQNLINSGNLGLGFQDLSENADNLTNLNLAPSGIRGLGGNDQINGSSTNSSIIANGNLGNDLITGGTGNDYLLGGKGNDTINGGSGDDLLSGNLDNDLLDGGEGNDLLRGGDGNDTLIGGGGNDILIGDRGTDLLRGSAGADLFVFRLETESGNQNRSLADQILDFNGSEGDQIAIAGEINFSSLSFTLTGSDTLIQLGNGDVIGVVLNSSPSLVQAATRVVSAQDLVLGMV
ncbi:MAG: peptidylprolyl isomerase [Pseudanabaenaceae cyanobacterium bins.68]|nr:peptidylprolyl isomerase [Pseudanabaenaceae cyanobacterium bins.68]